MIAQCRLRYQIFFLCAATLFSAALRANWRIQGVTEDPWGQVFHHHIERKQLGWISAFAPLPVAKNPQPEFKRSRA